LITRSTQTASIGACVFVHINAFIAASLLLLQARRALQINLHSSAQKSVSQCGLSFSLYLSFAAHISEL